MANKKIYISIIKVSIFMGFIAMIMFLFWKLELVGTPRPFYHKTDVITGNIKMTVGELREIRIRSKNELKVQELKIVVKDKNNKAVFEKKYYDLSINTKFQKIDYYSKENPITIEPGEYRVFFYTDGIENSEISGVFLEYSGNFKVFYIVLCGIIIVSLVLIIVVLKFAYKKLYYTYALIAILLGGIWNFIAPPLAMPDEYSHFLESYTVSHKLCGTQEKDNKGYVLIRAKDYDKLTYLHNISTISEWYISKEKSADGNEMVPSDIISTVSIRAKYVYLPSALGITFARIFDLDGRMLLWVGRIANLLVCIFMISLAIKKAPYGKMFFMCLGLIPEVILLSGSYSYDGINLALCILISSYYMYLCSKEKINEKNIMLLFLLIIVMIPIKVVYFGFFILLFLLPFNKVKISKKFIVTVSTGIAIGISIFLILYFKLILNIVGLDSSVNANKISSNDLVTVGYLLQNMERVILVVFRTFVEDTQEYVRQSYGLIYTITREGGLSGYNLPFWMCGLISLVLYIALEDTRYNEHTVKKRGIVVGIIFSVILGITASMLFAMTRVNYPKIAGIQGRYFLPILTLMPIVIKNKKLDLGIYKEKTCIFCMACINLCYIYLIFYYFATNYFI